MSHAYFQSFFVITNFFNITKLILKLIYSRHSPISFDQINQWIRFNYCLSIISIDGQ